MKAYLDLIEDVLEGGQWKGNRTGVRTRVVFGRSFVHDMSQGFPAITTKKLAFKTMSVELEGFIGGITDKRWYQDRGCKIWNEWANPVAVQDHINMLTRNGHYKEEEINRIEIQQQVMDLGPIYGYQWRRFCQHPYEMVSEKLPSSAAVCDQFQHIVDKLKKNPDDRRMIVSAWNPLQIYLMALPPCHLMFNLVHINGVLNLEWHQRSCDLMLGVPFNIASYAMLLILLSKESGLTPGYLKGNFADLHIYENHIDAANEQIKREPRGLPAVEFRKWEGIWSWTYEDVVLAGYDPHPKLEMGVAV